MSNCQYKIYPPLGIARVGNGPAIKSLSISTPEVPWAHLYDTNVQYLVTEHELVELVESCFGDKTKQAISQIHKGLNEENTSKLAQDDIETVTELLDLSHLVPKMQILRSLDNLVLENKSDVCSVIQQIKDAILKVLSDHYLHAVKKQAQNFYIYKCDEHGNPIEKLELGEGDKVTWRVEVANKKSFWYDYNNALDLSLQTEGSGNLSKNVSKHRIAPAQTAKRRNPNVTTNGLRKQLVISSQGCISNGHHGQVALRGKFPANEPNEKNRLSDLLNLQERHNVLQGSLECAEDGTLRFYAGNGVSQALSPSSLNTDFADNSNWFDDICDGRITALVELKEGGCFELNDESNSAWVATTPPDYAPQIEPLVTMYDMVTGAALKEGDLNTLETQFSDVFPILYRLYRMQWVNQADFTDNAVNTQIRELNSELKFAQLLDTSTAAKSLREGIFNQFRNPLFDEGVTDDDPNTSGSIWVSDSRIIPSKDKTNIAERPATYPLKLPFYPNDGVDYPGSPMQWFAIPPFMYQHLQNWAAGEFTVTQAEKECANTIEELGIFYGEQFKASPNSALLCARAALDALYGGGFHPGVELTWPMRHALIYSQNEAVSSVTPDISLLGLREFRLKQDPNGLKSENMYQDFGYSIGVENVTESVIPNSDSAWLWQNTPGDLTKWMGIPWQSDAASCQAVYTPEDFPIPSWWAANLPVHVLPLARYNKFKDSQSADLPEINGMAHSIAQGMSESTFEHLRLEQFSQRLEWLHTADLGFVGYHAEGGYTNGLIQMVSQWKNMGMVMARPVENPGSSGIPNVVYVAYSEADKD
ncbi:LodA/GoxA family CTQ-dependent oxidase [Pseudoalteromonas luteoviolacea]|uniref:LodA/GoxA family CTQ-dependent oxidase n=1 Tax=Pseudoalteromonas luteoviolacea TaxID=43657 RepID=UPI001B3A2A77|nr:LodA/GoxA family CTQ-dependent oxidase [Pseudoalteromonas luteoviolacea]MBQ4879951.1 LodA/GoxA family CTQ-dependent oxidase [Pseudoalteromonas luteoviolacea]MBQ4908968.1 LodA/GoxA family CTQ-dependent oxidase [Pseudoalteromonas luteoviolacea]